MLASKQSTAHDNDGVLVGSELVEDVPEEPAEKKMKTENLGKNDPGILSANRTKNEKSSISKRQLKKLRKKEKWLAYRPIKR
jgi:hypothetical protein